MSAGRCVRASLSAYPTPYALRRSFPPINRSVHPRNNPSIPSTIDQSPTLLTYHFLPRPFSAYRHGFAHMMLLAVSSSRWWPVCRGEYSPTLADTRASPTCRSSSTTARMAPGGLSRQPRWRSRLSRATGRRLLSSPRWRHGAENGGLRPSCCCGDGRVKESRRSSRCEE